MCAWEACHVCPAAVDPRSSACRLHAPHAVAFLGKRQFKALFTPHLKKVGNGRTVLRPDGWPFPASATAVWVLPSTSGRAAMTTAQRVTPYRQLASDVDELRRAVGAGGGEGGGAGDAGGAAGHATEQR